MVLFIILIPMLSMTGMFDLFCIGILDMIPLFSRSIHIGVLDYRQLCSYEALISVYAIISISGFWSYRRELALRIKLDRVKRGLEGSGVREAVVPLIWIFIGISSIFTMINIGVMVLSPSMPVDVNFELKTCILTMFGLNAQLMALSIIISLLPIWAGDSNVGITK